MVNDELRKYKEMRKAVEKRRVVNIFLAHLVAYIMGNMVLGLWNAGTFYLRGDPTLWFWIPLLFWGLGVLIHYLLAVSLFDDWWDRDERLIEERLQR